MTRSDPARGDARGDTTREIERLLGEQRAVAGQLDALSQRQESLIESGDTERLLGLLGERDALIGRLNSNAEAIAARRAAAGGALVSSAECERLEVAVRRLLDGVAERDRASRDAIKRRSDAIAGELTGGRKRKAAAVAYGPLRGSSPSVYQDRKA